MALHATQAAQMLRKMKASIQFEPGEENGQRGYYFRGTAVIDGLFAGLIGLALMTTSPTGDASCPLPREWG
jgi:hypothetical protein